LTEEFAKKWYLGRSNTTFSEKSGTPVFGPAKKHCPIHTGWGR